MKNKTLLLIANSSKARFFSLCKPRFIKSPKSQELKFEEEYQHEDSRKKSADLIADRAGIYGKGSYAESTTPKKQEAQRFAITLVEKLEKARTEDNNQEFIIVAPPGFLGILREHLTTHLNHKISAVIEKDYTSQKHNELATALINHL